MITITWTHFAIDNLHDIFKYYVRVANVKIPIVSEMIF